MRNERGVHVVVEVVGMDGTPATGEAPAAAISPSHLAAGLVHHCPFPPSRPLPGSGEHNPTPRASKPPIGRLANAITRTGLRRDCPTAQSRPQPVNLCGPPPTSILDLFLFVVFFGLNHANALFAGLLSSCHPCLPPLPILALAPLRCHCASDCRPYRHPT